MSNAMQRIHGSWYKNSPKPSRPAVRLRRELKSTMGSDSSISPSMTKSPSRSEFSPSSNTSPSSSGGPGPQIGSPRCYPPSEASPSSEVSPIPSVASPGSEAGQSIVPAITSLKLTQSMPSSGPDCDEKVKESTECVGSAEPSSEPRPETTLPQHNRRLLYNLRV